MKKLLWVLLSCVGCLQPQEDIVRESVQVGVLRRDGGCALSKVEIFDDEGNQYQAEGCTHGIVTFPEGRSFGWVDSLGTDVVGFNVVIFKE